MLIETKTDDFNLSEHSDFSLPLLLHWMWVFAGRNLLIILQAKMNSLLIHFINQLRVLIGN